MFDIKAMLSTKLATLTNFLNAYLKFRGAQPVDFDQFRTLPGSTATGSSGMNRLTNLMNLTVDTSWYTRYRSATNPVCVDNTSSDHEIHGLSRVPLGRRAAPCRATTLNAWSSSCYLGCIPRLLLHTR
jgi:hypothetical protein